MVEYLCHAFSGKRHKLGFILDRAITMLFVEKFNLQTGLNYLSEFIRRRESLYPPEIERVHLARPFDYDTDSDDDDDNGVEKHLQEDTSLQFQQTGIIAMYNNDWKAARVKFLARVIKERTTVPKRRRNMFLLATLHSAIAESLIHERRLSESKENLRKARDYLRNAGAQTSSFTVLMAAFVYIRSGALYFHLGKLHQSIEYFRHAISLLEKKVLTKLQERLKESVIFTRTVKKSGHRTKIITTTTFSDLWEMVEEFTKEDFLSQDSFVYCPFGKGSVCQYWYPEDTAVRRAVTEVLKNYRTFLEIIALLYNDLAWCYLFTGRPLLAVPCILKTIYIRNRGLDSFYYLAHTYTLVCLAMAQLSLDNFDDVVQILNTAIASFKMYSLFDQHPVIALLYVELGDVYTLTGNNDQLALESYTKAMDMLSELNDEENATDVHNHILQLGASRKFVLTLSYAFRRWFSNNKSNIIHETKKTPSRFRKWLLNSKIAVIRKSKKEDFIGEFQQQTIEIKCQRY